jgi:hypothetical protein
MNEFAVEILSYRVEKGIEKRLGFCIFVNRFMIRYLLFMNNPYFYLRGDSINAGLDKACAAGCHLLGRAVSRSFASAIWRV